ncbi:AP-1 complex subunit beta-1 [Folsomia candida]|uniref:AP-1 complex subunit beta-1 n=2 Tax=Folsomia candida TaxID=158441 RepID=A0A226D8M7_FOLCA|nr:AP-1 complex subunit beta-1 [Folsomia candida]
MIRLASQANTAQVLSELKEYSTEVDVDFVRKAVRAIGRCAIKVGQSAERCVATLLDLIQTKVNYVVQEAIAVLKNIFRKYPNKYESIISTLCENLDTLDEPEARASMIWIIGEYAERIDNADELLESFLEGFADENSQVQLQLLTAIVNLFLKRPADTQELVQQVLSLATQVAVKNNVDVLYYASLVPMHVYFVEDGQMDKRAFLQTWKYIPTQNEVQYTLTNMSHSSDSVVQKMQQNNVFTIAKRNVEGQDMFYQSLKLTNGLWVLVEIKIPPGGSVYTLSIKSVTVDVAAGVYQAYENILRS